MNQRNLIQAFINETEQFDESEHNLALHFQNLHHWHHDLEQQIQSSYFKTEGLAPHSPIMQQVTELNTQLQRLLTDCKTQLDSLQPAQFLADSFDQKVILLIFGKFNAGKSSLCNILAECFRHQQQPVQYFHLEAGHIVYSTDALQEGATETTSRLQGVCLGENLVLLDTPGLHSVTPENAELTQQFLESADGVLWLTSSSSPGQVKELEALGQELHRHKPLLPVLTRSDYLEEDEMDGELCYVLCNKSETQRKAQEHDVQQRATQKLHDMQVDPALLQTPVSISSQMLKQAAYAHDAMEHAGFNTFFRALLHLIEPTLGYKKRKPAEVLLHAMQEHLLTPLQTDTVNRLQQFNQKIEEEGSQLSLKKEKIITQTWRTVIPMLPALLEQHAQAQDTEQVLTVLHQHSELELIKHVTTHLQDYQLNIHAIPAITLPDDLGYELIHATETQEVIAIGHDRLYNELSKLLLQSFHDFGEEIMTQCKNILTTLSENSAKLEKCVHHAEHSLAQIAQNLRTT